MATPDELLRGHPLLGRLSPEQLARFAQVGERETWKTGEEILVRGAFGDSLYLVLSGSVSVHPRPTGNPVATLGTGEFFGEMSLVEPAARSATVRAIEPCELFRLPHRALNELLASDPQLMNIVLVTIVRVLSQRLRYSNELLGSIEALSNFLAGSLA